MDDGVREVAGVKGVRNDEPEKVSRVVVSEHPSTPVILVDATRFPTRLTPAEARRLARCLNHLARRIDDRV